MTARASGGRPTVVFGLPLYGHHSHVRDALESLLTQTYRDVRIVVCDESSAPRPDIRDLLTHPRVVYRRNEVRLGLIGNWRRVFELGRSLYPEAPYFAWASDHDLWDPGWADAMVRALQEAPGAVLAYPSVAQIAADGTHSPRGWVLDTAEIRGPLHRLLASYDQLAAGDMVYGLYRTAALERSGVFPNVLAPDRLLLAELSLHGTFVQVPQLLWSRRKDARFSLTRQRAALFGPRSPWYAPSPWWLQHAAAFTRDVALRDRARLGHVRAISAAWLHACLLVRRAAVRLVARVWTRTRLRSGAAVGRRVRRAGARIRNR